MKNKKILLYILVLLYVKAIGQIDSAISLTFDFNDHKIKEINNKVQPKAVGVSLVKDRFGNDRSAVYTHGHLTSYLNLGTSKLLKSSNITISLWVNFERRVYSGTGYESNPILSIKNSDNVDFCNAYAIGYESYSGKLAVNSTKDSTKEVTIFSANPINFNQWYHIVFVCNNDYLAFYLNGILEGKATKNFETKILTSDSIVIGHSARRKNLRYSQAIFDDINVFHRSLSEKEIIDLYQAPNPNQTKQFFYDTAKYIAIIAFFVIIIIILIVRNKKNLKRQKEQFELQNKINELEIKVIKNQMNPHFISNCLAAIQELIYTENYKKAALYIAKFSFFLRQVLTYSDKTYTSLTEELEIIKLNVELEQLRFKENFEFNLRIEDDIDLNDISIPSLITQPFIENAIWHGLLPLENSKKACLTISIFEKGDSIFVEIEDNGVGRKLNALPSKNSKGTKLVQDKIESINKLLGNNNYRFTIIDLFNDDKTPKGTKISIQIKQNLD